LCVALLLVDSICAQTVCSREHTDAGVFICYPDPAHNPGEKSVPELFHLSATANSPKGQEIRGYIVSLDGTTLYANRLVTPVEELSIELNLRSRVTSGSHKLHLVVDGAGTADVNGMEFYKPLTPAFCDPTGGVQIGTCIPTYPVTALDWSLPVQQRVTGSYANGIFGYYTSLGELYRRNLKSIESDIADAVDIDSHGNLFVAMHLLAGFELRKYASNGSIIYDSVIGTCSDPSLSIAAVTSDNAGHVWLAGNMKATCLPTTAGVWQGRVSDTGLPHGFVVLLDTSQPSLTTPIYATYIADVRNRLTGIRVDPRGNAYISGVADSVDFPHTSTVSINEGAEAGSGEVGFVSVLNPTGSRLEWSTIIRGARPLALALNPPGEVYVTGRTLQPQGLGDRRAFVAALSGDGSALTYLARYGGDSEGRAMAAALDGQWIFVQGETDQATTTSARGSLNRKSNGTFMMGLEPCGTRMFSFYLPVPSRDSSSEVADQPSLDGFAKTFATLHGGPHELDTPSPPAIPFRVSRSCTR
jgi:hypothetical protein